MEKRKIKIEQQKKGKNNAPPLQYASLLLLKTEKQAFPP